MKRYASLSSPSSVVRGKLQAALYYARKKRHPSDTSQVFILTLSPSNDLDISGIRNAPSWLEQDDFEIEFADASVAAFSWSSDHWELSSGEFPTADGIAVLNQGDNSMPIRWSGAEVAG